MIVKALSVLWITYARNLSTKHKQLLMVALQERYTGLSLRSLMINKGIVYLYTSFSNLIVIVVFKI